MNNSMFIECYLWVTLSFLFRVISISKSEIWLVQFRFRWYRNSGFICEDGGTLRPGPKCMRGSRGPDPPPLWKMNIYWIYIVKLSQICLGAPLQTQLSFGHPEKNMLDPRKKMHFKKTAHASFPFVLQRVIYGVLYKGIGFIYTYIYIKFSFTLPEYQWTVLKIF